MTRQLINRMIKTGSCTSFASSRVKKGGVQCRRTTTRVREYAVSRRVARTRMAQKYTPALFLLDRAFDRSKNTYI